MSEIGIKKQIADHYDVPENLLLAVIHSSNGDWRSNATIFGSRSVALQIAGDYEQATVLRTVWSTLAEIPNGKMTEAVNYFGCKGWILITSGDPLSIVDP